MDLALAVRASLATRRDHRPTLLAAGGAAALAGAAISADIALDGTTSHHPALVAAARALITFAPIAVGLYAWYRRLDERFGTLLVLTGAVWFVSTFAESRSDLPYTVGRAAGWLAVVLLVHLILSFPSGRLDTPTDRRLVAATGVAAVTLVLPWLLLSRDLEAPSPFTSCVHDCPPNAFVVAGGQPAWVDGVLRPAGLFTVIALVALAVARLWRRRVEATPLTRRMLTPVLAVGTAQVLLIAALATTRLAGADLRLQEVLAWAFALALPAVALAFLVGLIRWRLFAGRALQRLALCVRTMPDAATLRLAFAEAFDDPQLAIVFPSRVQPGVWTDCWGDTVALPAPGAGRSVSEVRHDGAVVAAIVHDEALAAQPELLAAGSAMAEVTLENHRLAAETEAAMSEIEQSRARISASAERERRRIERDLHDGAQQRLVALRIELGLAEELVLTDPAQAAERLRELEDEVDEALEELRALAHGVYPPLLADRGLEDALRSWTARCPVPVVLELHEVGRYAPETESAVYFCVLEALQNVLKHAAGARRAVVRLERAGGELRFSVRDDGAGAPDGMVRPGNGITNMRDRLAAIGGRVEISSAARVGTVVRGRVPARAPMPV